MSESYKSNTLIVRCTAASEVDGERVKTVHCSLAFDLGLLGLLPGDMPSQQVRHTIALKFADALEHLASGLEASTTPELVVHCTVTPEFNDEWIET